MRILAHGDTDGLTSAAVAAKALGAEADDVYFSRPTSLLKELRQVKTDVVILDIALFDEEADATLKELHRIAEKHTVTYIDHHPLPEGVHENDLPDTYVHDTERSTAELAYFHFRDKLSREFSKVAMYGAIGDYNDETPWVREHLERWDKRVIYFQAGMLLEALGEARYKYNFKRNVVRGLLKGEEPSEMPKVVELALREAEHDKILYEYLKKNHKVNGSVAYSLVDKGSLAKGAHLVMGIAGTDVGVVGKPNGDHVDMSLRACKSCAFDLATLAKKVTAELGGSAGGHAAAAGAQVPIRRFEEFIERLAKSLL